MCVLRNKALILTHNIIFCWYSDLISHKHKYKHTHTDTQYTQGPVDSLIHINIYNYTNSYVLTAAIFITMNE